MLSRAENANQWRERVQMPAFASFVSRIADREVKDLSIAGAVDKMHACPNWAKTAAE